MNLCRTSETETTKLCRKLSKEVYCDWMKDPPEKFTEMIAALLSGFWCVDVMLNHDAIMNFWYTLNGLNCKYIF